MDEHFDGSQIVEFKANTERGVVVSEVKINPAGPMVNGRRVVDVKEGEDGGIYLLYKERRESEACPSGRQRGSPRGPPRTIVVKA